MTSVVFSNVCDLERKMSSLVLSGEVALALTLVLVTLQPHVSWPYSHIGNILIS